MQKWNSIESAFHFPEFPAVQGFKPILIARWLRTLWKSLEN
ncbi:hypothetical protein CKA32_004456 [Geitlerinema sp. FC II]|nr:hypothetical protein CKA32_004456 [Geitlerinema sp. FC II]